MISRPILRFFFKTKFFETDTDTFFRPIFSRPRLRLYFETNFLKTETDIFLKSIYFEADTEIFLNMTSDSGFGCKVVKWICQSFMYLSPFAKKVSLSLIKIPKLVKASALN